MTLCSFLAEQVIIGQALIVALHLLLHVQPGIAYLGAQTSCPGQSIRMHDGRQDTSGIDVHSDLVMT